MTREERIRFIRDQIYAYGTWEDAVGRIVDRWEDDVTEVYETSKLDPRDAIGNVGH